MTIKNKDVQGYRIPIGEICAGDMESLGKATMPSRI